MQRVQKLTPCLWFDDQAEEAAKFYCSIFDHSKITAITHYGKAGQEVHGRPEGSVLTVSFELDGQPMTALNGGPVFKFNEAVSFQVNCQTQEEVDYFWGSLSAHPENEQCGWVKDKFGLSWQIVPVAMMDMLKDPDTTKSQRAMQAMMQMKKLDIAALQRAFNGES
ncbi:putative 3-demethylubiquinone-9 3-methyltransferase (glyoxalase superfamily) [Pseudomonas sp. JAI111]|uniref:VOC family protein n=1 Tax=unclassified Pseudomonas TaxID=196821 RepID=UPI001C9A048F|nr:MULTISPECIES: VOC family protein [unclassified Pseudomonas]MCS3838456.1 putative 3-demethylubiquinone-9 3-methyltransferase (glyoxalase superfamily) [Pseudomonas sp. JAI111]QZP31947.1 VOC family protein [Pseudomonas sp. DR48]